MAYALVSTAQMDTMMWTGTPASYQTVTVEAGTIINLIAYDGVSPYTPADNTALMQVPDTANVGDTGYTPPSD